MVLTRPLFDGEQRLINRINQMSYLELMNVKEHTFILTNEEFKYFVEFTIRERELTLSN